MNRISKLITLTAFATIAFGVSAEARQVWYGPGSGPNPFAKAPAPQAHIVTTPTPLPPQNCVAGNRCYNGYLDGQIPTGIKALPASGLKPIPNCVAGSRCFNGFLDGQIPNPMQWR